MTTQLEHRGPRRADRPGRRGARPAAPRWCSSSSATRRATRGPRSAYAGGADRAARRRPRGAGVDLYVHAPYIVNVATTNNRIRIPSRKLLQQHIDAAAEIGAKGLIVHGGHVNKDDDPAKGFDNWRKAVEATDIKIPLLIENTAGGDNAMARHLDRIAGVWDAIVRGRGRRQVGLLPRHLPRLGRRHRARHGGRQGPRRSPAGSTWCTPTTAATPSTPAPTGTPTSAPARSPPDELAGVVRAAGAPVICETPGGAAEHRADFAWLRERL